MLFYAQMSSFVNCTCFFKTLTCKFGIKYVKNTVMLKFTRKRGYLGILVLILLGGLTSLALKGMVLEFTNVPFRIIFSFLFSFLPGIMWLMFFYHQDEHEKEPLKLLLGVFILSAIAASGFGYPLEQFFRKESELLDRSSWSLWLNAVCVLAVCHELTKFFVLKHVIFNHKEFNEPADGIIYGVASGLGFAAMYNFLYLYSLESINMDVVPIRIIQFYLTSATFSGVMGYFFSQAKFSAKHSERTLTIGFAISCLLNGTVEFIDTRLKGIDYNAWTAMLFTTVLVISIFTFLFIVLKTSVEKSPFKT